MILERTKRILHMLTSFPHSVTPFNSNFLRNFHLIEGTQVGGLTRLTLGLKVLPEFANAYGPMHGGAICTLIDDATTLAIYAADEDLRMTVSVDLSVSFASSALVGDQLTVIAECNKKGKTLIFSTASIMKGEKLVALGKHTKYLRDSKLADYLSDKRSKQ